MNRTGSMNDLEHLLRLVIETAPEARGSVWAVTGAWTLVHVLKSVAVAAAWIGSVYFAGTAARAIFCRDAESIKLFEGMSDERVKSIAQARDAISRQQVIDKMIAEDRPFQAASLAEKWFAPNKDHA